MALSSKPEVNPVNQLNLRVCLLVQNFTKTVEQTMITTIWALLRGYGPAVLLVFGLLCYLLIRLYNVRSFMLALRRQGFAMPPYHPILGHLIVCHRILSKLPADVNRMCLPNEIRQVYPDLGTVYYLDIWPFIENPILVTASPDSAYQITQEHSLPKFHAMRTFLRPLTGDSDLVTMEGQEWKRWRAIYNPGFSLGKLMNFVPEMVKLAETFCEVLLEHAQQECIFPLKRATDGLALDIIGQLTLGTDFDEQRSNNVMVSALRRQIPWLINFEKSINPWNRFNPFRPFVHYYNARIMNQYISRKIDDRLTTLKAPTNEQGKTGKKNILDLALKAYLAENPTITAINLTFKSFAISQIKLFIFSGHDTTASTMSFVFYLLSKHPLALATIRAEHVAVLGTDLATLPATLATKPHLLNNLPYTMAVIKETLRLFPVVSSTRAGEPTFSVRAPNGVMYPTNHCLVWSIHHAIHRDPAWWPRADDFVPERWIVGPDDPLHPMKGAWRPFEFGPRNCIGQELAMLEIKVVVVMAVRRFEFQDAYEDWDVKARSKGPRLVGGERAYQANLAGPSEGMPMRVRVTGPRATSEVPSGAK